MNLYVQYFKYLAQKHPQILHIDEVGKYTFDVVTQTNIRDLSISQTDINPAAEYIMLLVSPTIEGLGRDDGGVDDLHTGAFFILKKFAARNNDKRDWWNFMPDVKAIVKSILRRIVKDSRNKHPLFQRSVDVFGKLNYKLIERVIDEKWYGYLVTFNFKNITPDCPDATTPWTDAGVTPY